MRLISFVILYLLFCCASATENSVKNNIDLKFNVGVDAQYRDMKFGKGYGSEVFKQHYPQSNLYATVILNEYVGLEVGYELTSLKTKAPISGKVALGIELPGNTNAFISKSRTRGWNVGIVGYFPITDFFGNNMNILGYIGQVNLKICNENILVRDNAGYYNMFDTIRHFVKHKHLLKIGLGAQYSFGAAGVRFMVYHEDTNKIKNLAPVAPRTSQCKLTFRNSTIWSVGIFLNFPNA